MEKKYDVIGIENLIMDLAMQIDHLPPTDGMSALYGFLWQSGGNASSATVANARLGGKCAMLSEVGSDEFGTFCKKDMEWHGVDISHVYTREGDTTLCLCLAEDETKGRSFISRGGVSLGLTDEEVDESFIASAKYIHCSAQATPMRAKAIEYARKNGVIVSYDAGGYRKSEEEMIGKTDIFIMSEMFYEGMFGDDPNYLENCKKVLAQGPKIVIVTLGGKGCVGTNGEEDFELPAFSGYEIVDTTGAGDVFHGGFLYAHNQGWSLKECARFASTVSYINCMSLGGRVGIPNLEMVEHFLETNEILPGDIQERKDHYKNIMYFK